MPLQRSQECWNGVLELKGKIGKICFFWGGEAGGGSWLRTLLRDDARRTGQTFTFHTNGDEGYINSVQPPLSEIPQSLDKLESINLIIRSYEIDSA